ncbi:tyrosine-type recombinase/integrase [Streptomyces griseoruber]|uniref:tyrosine-type recombinase/integrase n=1 Tax=Streptomyces griseoruber TaxID=1943 RepID=UPI000A5BF012|nr:site-specific integrase [Streptomyces griseoruber]
MTSDLTTISAVPRPRTSSGEGAFAAPALRVGLLDQSPPGEVLAAALRHAERMGYSDKRKRDLRRGVPIILDWLASHPGEGWQERWLASHADADLGWLSTVPAGSSTGVVHRRATNVAGIASLLLNQVILPSHSFLAAYSSLTLFRDVWRSVHPEVFDRILQQAKNDGMVERRLIEGMNVLSKLVLHTGRGPDQLTPEDFEDFRHWGLAKNGLLPHGIYPGWDLLRGVCILPKSVSYKAFQHQGQRPTAELVDRYRLRCKPVRDALVRYLEERRPSLDYVTFQQLIIGLISSFWADIEAHHPEVDSLQLPEEVAAAWKERMKYVTKRRDKPRPRKSYLNLLVQVRSLYLDIQEWALEDPSWAPHAVPSPVRRGDTDGMQKHRRRTRADMHQRVRERLPHLPVLVEAADRHRAAQETLLAAARAVPIGERFEHDGVPYLRFIYKTWARNTSRSRPEAVMVENLANGEKLDLFQTEDDAFWSWAVIETLRHTGIRREELLEITHLALVSYRLADTGELVPLLQIVPSKNNEERLLLISPELASVLATVITRLRHANGGTIPLTSQYDPHERAFGPILPHLFQRRTRGHRNEVMCHTTVQNLLDATLARTGLRDAAGEPLKFTPHDFRRMFATEAVTGGLPVHIAARLLGHEDLSTTQAYLAVFQEDLIRSYRSFLDQRRSLRPTAEYRDPTDDEWREFQQHFALRKLELGICGRPYGTPCKHEHACIRCPMLRVDPAQRARLIEIIRSLTERIAEAKLNGWLGEEEGLRVSLEAARNKLTAMDRTRNQSTARIADLGIPQIRKA